MQTRIFFCLFWLLVSLAACKDEPCVTECKNGGVCKSGICDCPDGYTGTSCQTKINPCWLKGCDTLNSTCVELPSGDVACVCNTGYEGATCDQIWQEKFYGKFVATENCDNGLSNVYDIEITAGTKAQSILIKNFHNAENNGKVICDIINATTFVIPPMPMAFGYLSGMGEISFDRKTIDISYLFRTSAMDTIRCTASYARKP